VWKEEDRSATVFNLESGEEVLLPDSYLVPGFSNPTVFDTFSPDGRFLAYVANGHTVHVWSVPERRVRHRLKGHFWKIWSMVFSPNGKLLATCSTDSDALVWDMATGKQATKRLRGHQQGVHTVWFTPDSRMLLTASDDPAVRFWNLATGQETLAIKDANEVLLSAEETTLVLRRRDGVSLLHIPTLAEIDAAPGARFRPVSAWKNDPELSGWEAKSR
jgi:WD40 repeat protein